MNSKEENKMNDRTTATAARFGISEQTAAPGSTDPMIPENLTKKRASG